MGGLSPTRPTHNRKSSQQVPTNSVQIDISHTLSPRPDGSSPLVIGEDDLLVPVFPMEISPLFNPLILLTTPDHFCISTPIPVFTFAHCSFGL